PQLVPLSHPFSRPRSPVERAVARPLGSPMVTTRLGFGQDDAVTALKLLCYNVRSVRDDADALARVMRAIAPDVAIIQEAPPFLVLPRGIGWGDSAPTRGKLSAKGTVSATRARAPSGASTLFFPTPASSRSTPRCSTRLTSTSQPTTARWSSSSSCQKPLRLR